MPKTFTTSEPAQTDSATPTNLTKEDRIQLTIKPLQLSQVPSVRQAAQLFEVPKSTLQLRINGAPAIQDSGQHLQRLNKQDEDSIV
ncbi:hypothetical protein QBC46DRAFT_378131 [Diplogelasinospora grovesii]|uniref:HTH psq-type domain-containing protein n=1 Tax=Diplogelasinospora grovesii TaxID=303347 RepID=A0AAN6NDI8_9PEZI|nr:hypothetical protein QBC46DRAFT_378131 [Diplogelasinospora grovesii]